MTASRRPDDVLVVGAGVIGLSIADSLGRAGLRVRVLEAEGIGAGASGAAAGMLAPISESTGDEAWLRMGLESLVRLPSLCARLEDETGIDPELEASGLLRLVASDAERARFEHRRALMERLSSTPGWPLEPVLEWRPASELYIEEPALALGFIGAFRSPLECHLRPPKLVEALAASVRARGAEIELDNPVRRLCRAGWRVVGVESGEGRREAGAVVVAAGPWSAALLEASAVAADDGASPAVEPVRGQILSLEAPLPATRAIVWSDDVYLVPKRDGRWIVGATQERVGFDRRVTAEGVAWLLERARAVFPSLAQAGFGRVWAGLRPVSRDAMPFVGPVPGCEGLWLATGHGRNGVLLSAITAERIRDALLGREVIDPTDPMHPGRAFRAAPA